jgi:hypothetical protein
MSISLSHLLKACVFSSSSKKSSGVTHEKNNQIKLAKSMGQSVALHPFTSTGMDTLSTLQAPALKVSTFSPITPTYTPIPGTLPSHLTTPQRQEILDRLADGEELSSIQHQQRAYFHTGHLSKDQKVFDVWNSIHTLPPYDGNQILYRGVVMPAQMAHSLEPNLVLQSSALTFFTNDPPVAHHFARVAPFETREVPVIFKFVPPSQNFSETAAPPKGFFEGQKDNELYQERVYKKAKALPELKEIIGMPGQCFRIVDVHKEPNQYTPTSCSSPLTFGLRYQVTLEYMGHAHHPAREASSHIYL